METIINRAAGGEDEVDERNSIDQFIYEFLLDEGGSANARDVLKSGVAAGFSESTMKKRRAKMTDPKVSYTRHGAGKGSKVVWAIDSPIDSIDSHSLDPGTYGTYAESIDVATVPAVEIGVPS